MYFQNYRLAHLKRQCEPHLVEAVKDSVETLCSKVFHISAENVKKIRERHLQILKENGLPEPPTTLPQPVVRKVWCYSIQFLIPPTRMPSLEYTQERDHMVIKYSHAYMQLPDTQFINLTHLQKLVN